MPLHQPCLMVSQLELAYHLYIHCDNKFCTTIALFCAVWGMTFAVFLLGLPMLGGATAFDTASSIATAGLCLAYALPIGFRIVFAHHSFEPGPFSLGRYCHLPPLSVHAFRTMRSVCTTQIPSTFIPNTFLWLTWCRLCSCHASAELFA